MQLTITNLGKEYKHGFWGLKDFSLEVNPGILGLLGPNGAGKTTLMRMLATITQPSQGTVKLKLLLKGQRWWWYVVALGLIIAQFASNLENARMLLAVTWLWPILLLSGLGSREARHNTREMVFSAPRPVLNQLPATWLAAFAVIALMGSGAFLRFLFAGEMTSLLAWLAGALFIPSLVLSFGVLTGSSKSFEVVYVLWMYIILQKVASLDFVGVTLESPWYIYTLLALALLVLAAFVRQRQLTAKNH